MSRQMDKDAMTQSDKFKDLAREVEAGEDEAAFDAKLRKMKECNPSDKEPPGDD